MTTENTASAEVVVAEPTLASVRAAREAAVAKAKEEQRIREKTWALQTLDGFVLGVSDELKSLDAEVTRIAGRRKKLEEALSVAKSIENNADVTAEEIGEVRKKASDIYHGRKEGELPTGMIQFIEPRFEDQMIYDAIRRNVRSFARGGIVSLR